MPPEAGQSPTVSKAAQSFLDEHPDAQETLEAVLAVDAGSETWTFDDVPADSGTFGELVSRGIVEKSDGEYQLADRDAVAATVNGGAIEDDNGDSFGEGFGFDMDLSVDTRAVIGLAGALVFLFVMRITAYRSVMREEHVVSPGNDPYYFRYWMEELLARSSGPADWGVIANMPEGVGDTRPLSHATNWFVAELLGGGQAAASTVAAWLPVVATLALGVVLYKLATVLTDDPRVGIASVFVLATIPAHAVYTGVGFLDHNAHQYFWLGVTVLSLSWLAVDLQERREREASDNTALQGHLSTGWTWLAVVGLGVGVGFSTHAWGGSPLVLVPLAGYLALRSVMDARAGVSPVRANLPALAGLGIGGGISYIFHAWWGWHDSFVAYTPGLVFGGAVGVLALGECWRRIDIPLAGMVALEGAIAVVGIGLFRYLRPEDVARLRARADQLFFREGMTEAQSLFAAEYGFIFGPLTQTGLAFYLALVPLGWATWVAYQRYEPGWLLMAVFSWYFMALAGIQMRFTGQFSLFVAVLGGLGLVYVLSAVDLARTPKPFGEGASGGTGILDSEESAVERPSVSFTVPEDRGKTVYLAGIFVLFAGLGMLLVPSLVSQVTYTDAEYETATAIAQHSDDAGREYPSNYVLSEWDRNRMYNYFASGESESYAFARESYPAFVSAENPDERYDAFDDRVGYVVVDEPIGPALTNEAHGEYPGHYRALYVSDDVGGYAIVPGAQIEGSAAPGTNVTAETDISVDGASFTYERETTAGDDGSYSVRVAYPGDYTTGNESVHVTEADVESGETVTVEDRKST